ncbi:PilN domain-containing protein [Oceanibacterium hippocampi]|uniref:Fimbrial assembly protein (PilN) n=1 Tax=Oceanibacterium hippocampi TaxID=745714 RepID=A0A1Y5T9D3_9PROT|nr:PilN domain-containing protein [Oceanibacterium hippocampi]SLN56833.1 Fimbrial assembly protein (PilN) [Oceanibacterium hippocampi]
MTRGAHREKGWIGRFLDWWGGALRGALPPSLSRALGFEDDVLLLRQEPGRVAFWRLSGGRNERIGEVSVVAGEAGAPPLAAAVRQAPSIVLRLSPDLGLRKTVRLPAAAAENLDEVLAFEMERQTPFRADKVHFYYENLSAGEDGLSLDLSVVPRAPVQEWLDRLTTWGLRPDIVDLADDKPFRNPAPSRNLVPPERRSERASPVRTLNAVLLVAMLLAALLAVWSPRLWLERRSDALQAEIADLRPEVEDRLRARRLAAGDRTGLLNAVADKASAPVASQILERLSAILPDDTWIQQFNIVDGRVELQGSTSSAATLVPILEGAPEIASVAFRTAVSRDAVSGRENFEFIAELARAAGGKATKP